MIYAMNLYDIKEGKEDTYREYMIKSGALTADLGIEPVVSGHNPIKTITGKGRNHFAIARFPNLEAFEAMIERQNKHEVNLLRESATENYIWTLYEEWDPVSWLSRDM